MSIRIRILRSEDDYAAALAEYEGYFDNEPEPGSEAGDRFELLGVLIERYEDEHFPMPRIDAVEAIRFAMDRKGYDQSDLATLLGSRSRASEILNRKRRLTLEQIRKLVSEWSIPAATLVSVPEYA